MSNEKIASAPRPEKLVAVKGMNDILPPESARWEWLEAKVRTLMARYAYRNIRTPIVEPTPLFVRGLGEVTDIVEKEMYSFEDRLNGEHLTLRPRQRLELFGRWLNIPCCTRVVSGFTTWVLCSGMNVHSAGVIGSFTRLVLRLLAFQGRKWMPN